MELSTFKQRLDEKMAEIKELNPRPFVCDGSPLDCKVFIVGINPATQMEGNFWDDKKGFLYEKWDKTYREYRLSKGKQEVSPTRNRINKITNFLKENSIKTLETNTYTIPTKDEKELYFKSKADSRYKSTDTFKFLLENIDCEFVLIHGKSAAEAFENMYNITPNSLLRNNKKTQNEREGMTSYYVNTVIISAQKLITVMIIPHLSPQAGLSNDDVSNIGGFISASFLLGF